MSISTAAAAPAPASDPRAPRRVRHEPRRRTSHRHGKSRPSPRTWFASRYPAILRASPVSASTITSSCSSRTARRTPRARPTCSAAISRRAATTQPQDTLEIDFAIHDAGPATRWAAQAKPGDTLALGGPRGSFIIPTTYDWHLLDRRRDRPARHQPPACRTSGPNPHRRRRRSRRPRRRDRIADRRGRDRDLGPSQRRRGRRQRCAGKNAGKPETARRRLTTPGSPASRSSPRRCAGN